MPLLLVACTASGHYEGPGLLAAFAALAEDFGLVAQPYEPSPRGGRLRFVGEVAQLSISFEAGARPWVTVRASGAPEFGLHELVESQTPERAEEAHHAAGEGPEAHLARLAELTREFGAELLDARSYQAIWDYEYSLVEVGAFLKESALEVQARLDRWDGLVPRAE